MSNSKYKRGDKILDNSFNSNNTEFILNIDNTPDNNYVDFYLDYTKDSHEYDRQIRLEKHIIEIIENSKYSEFYKEPERRKNIKFEVDYLSELYNIVYIGTPILEWSRVEQIVKLSEVMRINLSQLFNSIPPKMKEELLNELHESNGIYEKINRNKLF